MAMLGLGRASLVLAFRDQIEPGSGLGSVLAAFANGMRFDAPVAAAWMLPGLVMSIVAAFTRWERAASVVRQVMLGLFIFTTVLLAVITYGYFREYGTQFDERVYGVIEDDFAAVLATVWKEYPATTVAIVMLGFDAALFFLVRWLVNKPLVAVERLEAMKTPWRVAAIAGLVVFLVVAARGSIGRRPVQDKDAAITADAFLNKTVINPYKALEYTIEIRQRLMRSSSGIRVYLPDGDIRAAAGRAFGEHAGAASLDSYLERRAAGWPNRPRHVVLVVMESYSAWPLEEPYRQLGVANEVERLGRSGILFTRFLPASGGTMMSLATILTGVADNGAPICYAPNSRRPYPTSLAAIFRRMGYRTRFFYGGYLSWQRMGDFARDQGFDEVYGGGDVLGGKLAGGNEWGVPDEKLFDFALGKITDEQPSLDVFMTVSNHPPFDVDVAARGFGLSALPPALAPMSDGGYTMKQLGHFWYGDLCLGHFVDALEKKLPKTLVAATGDHYGRRFLNAKPGLVERSFVPFLLHGPEVLAGARPVPGACGAHVDIPATLIELAAPEGFSYHAMGRSVLGPRAAEPAFGADKVVGPGFVAELSLTPEWAALNAGTGGQKPAPPDLKNLKRRECDLRAVGWWRVLRGAELPKEGEKARTGK